MIISTSYTNLLNQNNMANKYEFAIKKDTLKSGKVILTPVCRVKSRIPWLQNPWIRIIDKYGRYFLEDLNFDPELSHEECQRHIQGFQNELAKAKEHQISHIELDILEEKTI